MEWVLGNILIAATIMISMFFAGFIIYLITTLITKAILKAKEDFHDQRKRKGGKGSPQSRDKR